jgi:hypothetical protein
MTIQELIDRLNEIENKSQEVFSWVPTCCGSFKSAAYISQAEDGIVIEGE